MSAVEFSIVTPEDTIQLITDLNVEGTYLLMRDGTGGFGVAPRSARFGEGAGEGGTYRGTRVLMRDSELNIRVYGASRSQTESNISRLVRAIVGRAGLRSPRLVAAYATGEVYELPFVYVSGAESAYLPDSSDEHTTLPFVIRATKPFWTARDAMGVTVRNEASADDLLDDLAAIPLASATAIGTIEVDNPGDVDSYVDWEIVGPGGPATIAVNGVGFVIDTELLPGERRIVDGRRGTVEDADGDSRYTELGPAPRFPKLPPGRSTIVVDLEGADPGEWVADTDTVVYTNLVTQPTLTAGATTWDTWSNGNGTQSTAAIGFAAVPDIAPAGYMQIAWSAASDPDAAIIVDFALAPGTSVSPSMYLWSTRAQVVQGGLWLFDAAGDVVTAVFGPATELPAVTPTRVAIPGSILGPVPAGVVSARFAVSTFVSLCSDWQAGDQLRGSIANATTSDSVVGAFTGDSPNCAWTGADDASTSVQYALELVGASEIVAQWKPRKELVY